MRAKLLAEGLWPPVDIAGRPVRLQWGAVAGEGGRLEQDNVQREVNQGNGKMVCVQHPSYRIRTSMMYS